MNNLRHNNVAEYIMSSKDDTVTKNMGLEDANMQHIDEDLHRRQLPIYGRETMRRLFASNLLKSGMQGLGTEID
ncbi:hypothetical protein R6Q59_027759 [Mikania micrantha]